MKPTVRSPDFWHAMRMSAPVMARRLDAGATAAGIRASALLAAEPGAQAHVLARLRAVDAAERIPTASGRAVALPKVAALGIVLDGIAGSRGRRAR